LAQQIRGELKVDPITLSVIRGGMISLCYEMGEAVERSSYSPVFTEGLDFSCALFDGLAEEVALHAFDPNHMACVRYGLKSSLEEIGIENLSPGDIVFCNDPYRGGNHINDCTVYKPVFLGRNLVAFPVVRPHLLDLGGSAPGNFVGDATEIFQEGLRVPPIKLYKQGKLDESLLKFILANVRDPRAMRGDIDAVIGALSLAERRVIELVQRYGVEKWNAAAAAIKDASEKSCRQQIREIPEGKYEAEDYLDDDGVNSEPLKLKVSIYVKGDHIVADFDGSSRQAAGPINCTYAVTAGHTAIGIFHSLDLRGDVPVNEGSFRPIKVLVPPGTVLNVDYPGPCVAGNFETGPRVADLVVACLGQAVYAERTKGGCAGTQNGHVVMGVDRTSGGVWLHCQFGGGGQGARAHKDGNSGIMHWATNNKSQSVEVLETSAPVLYEDFSLVEDSGGPGKSRGGLGCRYVWRLLDKEAIVSSEADRMRFSPFGVYGGLPPKPLECGHASDLKIAIGGASSFKHATELFNVKSVGKWARIRIHKNDAVETITAGGGGYGNPLERDPSLVLRDYLEEYISLDAARDTYGVVISERAKVVREEPTRLLRKRLSKPIH
jgi:N-methylhydantoinase B